MPALLDARQEAFARFVAQGKKNSDAAKLAGFDGKFVSAAGSKLAKNSKVRQRIAELQATTASQVTAKIAKAETIAITEKLHRVASLQDLHDRLQLVVTERAADPKMADVPGGKSGLLVRTIKAIKIINGPKGQQSTLVTEFSLDAALVKELRATKQQASQELGQWQSKESSEDDRPVEKVQFQWVEPSSEDKPKPVKEPIIDPMLSRVQ